MVLFCGCAVYRPLKMEDLVAGMTKLDVIETLGRKPEVTVAKRHYSNGTLEVLQYKRRLHVNSSNVDIYWLYFLNNQLIKWGAPDDWKKEADNIVNAKSNK